MSLISDDGVTVSCYGALPEALRWHTISVTTVLTIDVTKSISVGR